MRKVQFEQILQLKVNRGLDKVHLSNIVIEHNNVLRPSFSLYCLFAERRNAKSRKWHSDIAVL